MAASITKLTDSSTFPVWKKEVEVHFTSRKLISIVDGSQTPDSCLDWGTKDNEAQRVILRSLSGDAKTHVVTCRTAKDMFTTLSKVYGRKQCTKCGKMGHSEKNCWSGMTFPPCPHCEKTNHPQQSCLKNKAGEKNRNNEKMNNKQNTNHSQASSSIKAEPEKYMKSDKKQNNKQNAIKNDLRSRTPAPPEPPRSDSAGPNVQVQQHKSFHFEFFNNIKLW
ncbi:uncharacterized protein LOC117648009 [Thrips palmi]|uniref:Uncharacterized protein LOC117648009 n=1 Tax=Thrips palmi TaxID=161013 RepID=A0A6P8Z0J4_THRPL|nr:uncharacterized protein LOC117648009 [Thrips palmi]